MGLGTGNNAGYLPAHFPIFKMTRSPQTSAMAKAWGLKLQSYLHNVVAILGIQNRSDVKADRDILYEIFTRIEKRRIYFHIYHGGMQMGEINEGALLCFWILKLMPFTMKGMSASLLNTKIAHIVFINLLHYVANTTNKAHAKKGESRRLYINLRQKVLTDLPYAFQYRDLSKEAIMALVESRLYEYFVTKPTP